MSESLTPAARLAALEREMADLLILIHELERHGRISAREHNQRRELQTAISALRVTVYGPVAAQMPVPASIAPAPAPTGPARRPSGMLRKIVEHTSRATEELARARSGELVPRSEAVTPVPDPLRLAASMIVDFIAGNPAVSRDRHEDYVLAILRDLTDPVPSKP